MKVKIFTIDKSKVSQKNLIKKNLITGKDYGGKQEGQKNARYIWNSI